VNADPNWFDGFFEQEWLDEIALHLPDERTQSQVDFVVERLGLEPGARVLDVACGHGRHSLELARRAFRVTGVDLSPRSLELAREAAQAEISTSTSSSAMRASSTSTRSSTRRSTSIRASWGTSRTTPTARRL
jgi:cyclopropane fatty-acyl-phospholipid synthase-like methyltransferase